MDTLFTLRRTPLRTLLSQLTLLVPLALTACANGDLTGSGGDAGVTRDASTDAATRTPPAARGAPPAVEPVPVIDHDPDVSADLARRAVDATAHAAVDPSLEPSVVYPFDGTMMPPNLYRMEWQWQPVAGADLYTLTFASPTARVHYVTRTNTLVLPAETWRTLTAQNRGRTVELTVHAARSTDLSRQGVATLHVTFSTRDLLGGLYYFTTNDAASQQGIFRYDFGVPVANATRYLSQQAAGGCVGCHALSRSGTRMAVTYESGAGMLATLDVGDPPRMLMGGPAGPERGAFLQFFDSDRSLLAVYDNMIDDMSDPLNGQLVVYDPVTGAVDASRQVPIGNGHRAAHAAIAPDGLTLAYTDYADVQNRPIREERGSIVISRYDPATRTWAAPRILVGSDGTTNNYYPSFSPDGRWVLFNRAVGSCYDNAQASIWVVNVDGTQPPIELVRANRGVNLTNSWPRWAPFATDDEIGATRFWFTFSSKRDYGLRLTGAQRPQLWMAAFDPVAAQAGHDASAPPFWLPFQDLETQNHTASWTERITPRGCDRDSDCVDPNLRCETTTHTCVTVDPPG